MCLTKPMANIPEGDELSDESILKRWNHLPMFIKIPAGLVAGWIVLILIIQIFNTVMAASIMPESCPENSGNCVRIAHDGTSYRAENLEPLRFNATREEVISALENWFEDRWFASVISIDDEADTTTLHGVDHTEFWFFADDVFASVTCSQGYAELTLHSQSRLGKGDMGENNRRLVELTKDISSTEWSNESCEG